MGLKINSGNETITAEGLASNIDIAVVTKGTGDFLAGNFTFDGDQAVGAGQDNFVLTWDNGAGVISLEAATGGGDTFLDNVFRIQDDADVTSQLAFTVDAIATATTRTWTVPDQNLDFTPSTGTFGGIATANTWTALNTFNSNITMGASSEVLLDDGTELLPGLTFASDTNSGMRLIGGDNIAFSLGGTDAFELTNVASAVNHIEVVNAATGNPPLLQAVGEVNSSISIQPLGTGNVLAGNFTFDGDQAVGAGQDNFVLTWDNGAGVISLEAIPGVSSTFLDNVFRIQDDADVTSQLAFTVDAIATATTRTWTVPDQNLDFTPSTGTFGGIATANTWTALNTFNANITMGSSSEVLLDDGTKALPGLAFASSTSLGIHSTAATVASLDAGGEKVLQWSSSPTPVNSLDVISADTGDNVRIAATGTDTDVGMTLDTKGAGAIVLFDNYKYRQATVQTTDATLTNLISIPIVDDQSIMFEISIIGRENATGDTVMEKAFIGLRREGATTSFVGEPFPQTNNNPGAAPWVIAYTVDDAADELDITVTGEAAHTIDWRIIVRTLEE